MFLNQNARSLLQVSAGQHMQLTGDLKPGVSVAAQQGMYFNQQQSQNQPGPGGQSDTYCSVSQSQTINFTQQSLRQRAAAGGVPQPAGPAGARSHPQQVPQNQVDQHQHAKILQQQQLMRAQQVRLLYCYIVKGREEGFSCEIFLFFTQIALLTLGLRNASI